jgi:hypothetical protein
VDSAKAQVGAGGELVATGFTEGLNVTESDFVDAPIRLSEDKGERGRGKRKKTKNIHFTSKFWEYNDDGNKSD